MNFSRIKGLQNEHGIKVTQDGINNGSVWKYEGSMGRLAMDYLEAGVCMLPKKSTWGYYGNRLPSRDELKPGTKGTYLNSKDFWVKVENGEIDMHTDEELYYE